MLQKRPEFHTLKYFIPLIFALFFGKAVLSQNVDLLPDTIRSCQVDSLELMVEKIYSTYLWSTGDTTFNTWVDNNGDYAIEVSIVDTVTTVIFDTVYVIIVDAYVASNDTTISCGDTLQLYGSNPDFLYFWEPVYEQTDTLIAWPRDTTQYYVAISNPNDFLETCTDSVKVTIEPEIMIDTMLQLAMGCPGDDKGKVKFEVSGGYPPYFYEWPLGADVIIEDSSQAGGLIDGETSITISDTIGCYIDHDFEVKAFPLPEMELFSDPTDTVYLQNPFVDFYFENPFYDSLAVDTFSLSWSQWKFGDNDSTTQIAPTHAYKKTGSFDVVLEFRTFYDCFGSDTLKLEVEPVKLAFPVAFSPNDDGANDFFEIWDENSPDKDLDLSKYYLSTSLVVFNQWGTKVFEVDNYQNDWDGEGLSDGTYFYVLQCEGEYQNKAYKGSVAILGSGSQ